ncbi:MAG: hypothetical protein GC182_06740 [Rhodopseudomonas sp.]|nr:hypothetical protein [Rhodopseudomonas sp.]
MLIPITSSISSRPAIRWSVLDSELAEVNEILRARHLEKAAIRIKYKLAALRLQTAMLRYAYVCRKAGFKEDQPRWPGGTPGTPKPGGRWSGGAGPGGVTVTTSPGFLTGISTIDNTSKSLSDTLVRVMETLNVIPESSPQLYGIAVHAAFATAVRLQNLHGIGYWNVERTFSLKDSDPRYGLAGSIRTDIALQNDQGDVIAIYDVKTGERRLSTTRANKLREMTRADASTPVFELNIVRGVSRKFRYGGLGYGLPGVHRLGRFCLGSD